MPFWNNPVPQGKPSKDVFVNRPDDKDMLSPGAQRLSSVLHNTNFVLSPGHCGVEHKLELSAEFIWHMSVSVCHKQQTGGPPCQLSRSLVEGKIKNCLECFLRILKQPRLHRFWFLCFYPAEVKCRSVDIDHLKFVLKSKFTHTCKEKDQVNKHQNVYNSYLQVVE